MSHVLGLAGSSPAGGAIDFISRPMPVNEGTLRSVDKHKKPDACQFRRAWFDNCKRMISIRWLPYTCTTSFLDSAVYGS